MKRTLRSQADYRQTMLRNQLTSLVLYEAVTTTSFKANQLIAFANRFFNRVKLADLPGKRLAHETLFDKNAVKKIFEEILPRYQKEDTTFTTTYRILPRHGDNAAMTMVTLTKTLSAKPEEAKETKNTKKAEPKAQKKSVKKEKK